MLVKLNTATVVGINAIPVEVEVDVSLGLPGFFLVGLPVLAVREGAVRIRGALENSGYKMGSMRVTVNLAPADVRKHGAAFDLPIALGILASSQKEVRLERSRLLIAGELSLDGRVKPIRGALSLARSARRQGLAGIVVPRTNAAEAALVEGLPIFGVQTLREAVEVVAGSRPPGTMAETALETHTRRCNAVDFADVVNLGHQAHRLLERHHDALVVNDVVGGEGPAWHALFATSVVEPLVADLVAADVSHSNRCHAERARQSYWWS